VISLKTQKFLKKHSKPKNFFERFPKKVNIIAVKTQKFKNQNSSKKMNIIARKTQKLKTAKSENNEHYY
jgi:hypothetical protein